MSNDLKKLTKHIADLEKKIDLLQEQLCMVYSHSAAKWHILDCPICGGLPGKRELIKREPVGRTERLKGKKQTF